MSGLERRFGTTDWLRLVPCRGWLGSGRCVPRIRQNRHEHVAHDVHARSARGR